MNSSPKINYTLSFSTQAEQDITGILQFGLTTWGETQAEKYQKKLKETFETLLANPSVGRVKEIYFTGCHMFHVGRHEIFYRLDGQTIHIVRILRDNMAFKQWF
ncbi:MAG: type II toxin-antitoxin system RelE/ParE family toxin [Alphaproteobacteria bacterium]|nr:type II toxin-antitoxin system RelE/ParE family toxin [Alphaproteobacteria bacterium]MCK5658887.1 type II toxin-antitoxin system RelE/ParE family toxin [Alphaproteobacteria bacterium]